MSRVKYHFPKKITIRYSKIVPVSSRESWEDGRKLKLDLAIVSKAILFRTSVG